MLLLTIALLAIVGVISFFYFQYNDSGVLNLNIAGETGSIPVAWFPYAIVALIVFVIALWMLSKIISIPKSLRRGSASRAAKKSRQSLDKGLLEIQSGEFARGEASLISQLDGDDSDAVKYLAAAKSAQARGAEEDAEVYLKKASDSSNAASSAVRTAQAEMMLQRGNYRDAETLLTNLHQNAPKNAHVMTLLASAMQNTGNGDGLVALVRAMRSRTNLPMSYVEPLEKQAWTTQLNSANEDQLERVWNSLTADAQKHEEVMEAYVTRLMDSEQHDKAEEILRNTMRNNWSDKLVTLYGNLQSSDAVKQMETVDAWLKDHPRSAALHSAIGKMAASRNLWAKSRDAFTRAAELELNPDVCLGLGQALEQLGNSQIAKDCYRSAAALANGKPAVGALLDPENLAVALAQMKEAS